MSYKKIYELPKLFSLNEDEKERFWQIWIEDNGDGKFMICRRYGIIDRKITEPESKIMNDLKKTITAVNALWRKKKESGFYEAGSKNPIKKTEFIKPMGAHKLDDHYHKIIYPAFVQKKLDGFRCLANNCALYSKGMKPFLYLAHIKKELAILKLKSNIYLDGELYEFGLRLHEISSLVHKESREISYYIFDMFDLKNMLTPFNSRYAYLESIFKTHKFKYLKLVSCVSVNNYNKVLELNNKYLLEGYEGVIVRNMNGLYKLNSKSYNVLRTKEFKKAKFQIIGASGGSGTQSGAVIWELKCTNSENSFFAIPIGTINERIKIYKDYISNPDLYNRKYATVKFLEMNKEGCVSRNPIVEKID